MREIDKIERDLEIQRERTDAVLKTLAIAFVVGALLLMFFGVIEPGTNGWDT